MQTFTTVNPATGSILKQYNYLSFEQAEKQLQAAESDFQVWRRTSFAERAEVLLRLAGALRSHKEELAQLMNLEMGKLISEGYGEVEKSAATCEYYAKEGAEMLKNQSVTSSPYNFAEVSFQPLGIVFSIMPWNFPLWQVVRFAAPAVMAGNVIALKHADMTAGTGALIEKIFSEASSRITLLRNMHVTHEDAARMIAHPMVRGVTFTGSSGGGRAVAIEAARNLKKIVLELGGSDAYLILSDANVNEAAKICARARLVNCGQSCVAGKRFIVDKSLRDSFLSRFVAEMDVKNLAPLASGRFQKQIAAQVEQLKSWGGQVLLGGVPPSGEGAFYPATVVLFEKDRPEIHQQEVFGPVAIVVLANDTQEALRIANSSPFGLGGGIFTQDLQKGRELIEKELEAGFVVVNDFVKSDPRIPFGGVKASGYGRELGHFGILEFVNIKTVAVAGEIPWI